MQPLPEGWWVVTTSSSPYEAAIPGTAWRFLPDEVQAVRDAAFVDRRKTTLHGAGADAWTSPEPSPFRLVRSGTTLKIVVPPPTPATLELRVATGDELAAAVQSLGQHGTLKDVCDRAAACFRDATRGLDGPRDTPREMEPGISLHQCEAITAGYVQMYKDLGRTVPVTCEK
jgi:hypothetical protein